jgi:hypothetical protein
MFEVRFGVDQGKHNAEIVCLVIAQKKEEEKRQEIFAHILIQLFVFYFCSVVFLFL